jgi:hypothetical protein
VSDDQDTEDPGSDTPLDQTEPPMDLLQEGDDGGSDTPLDQTKPEMDHFYGSQDHPQRPRRRK